MCDYSFCFFFVGYFDDGGIIVSFGCFFFVSFSEDFIVICFGRVFELRVLVGFGFVGSRV